MKGFTQVLSIIALTCAIASFLKALAYCISAITKLISVIKQNKKTK